MISTHANAAIDMPVAIKVNANCSMASDSLKDKNGILYQVFL